MTPTDLRVQIRQRSASESKLGNSSAASESGQRPPNGFPHAPFPHAPSQPRGGSRTGSRETARDAVAEQYAYSFGALSTLLGRPAPLPRMQVLTTAPLPSSSQVGPDAPPLRLMSFPPPPRTPDAALDDGSRPLTSGRAPPTGQSGTRPQGGLPQAGAVAAIISCRFDPSCEASCPSHPPTSALGTTLGTTLAQAEWPPPLNSLLGQQPHGQASVKASVKASGQACAIATPSRVPGAVLGAVLGAVPVLGGSSSAGNIRRPLTQGGAHVSRAADAKKTPFYALSADQQRQQLRKEWLAHGDASPSTEPLPKVSASVRPLYVPSAVPSSSWAARQPTEVHSSAPSAAAPLTVRRALPVGLAKSLPRPGTALEALEAFRELQGGDAAPRARLPKRSGSPLGVELYVATNLHGRQLVAL